MLGVISSYLLGNEQCKHFSGPVSAINACSCICYRDSEDLVLVLLASHIQKPKKRQKKVRNNIIASHICRKGYFTV